MTITIELGPKTIAALTGAIVRESRPLLTVAGPFGAVPSRKRKPRYVGEISSESFSKKYGVIQDARLFRAGCKLIKVQPVTHGSNRLYIPENRAQELYRAIVGLIKSGAYKG